MFTVAHYVDERTTNSLHVFWKHLEIIFNHVHKTQIKIYLISASLSISSGEYPYDKFLLAVKMQNSSRAKKYAFEVTFKTQCNFWFTVDREIW
jgi:hypothetical protein